MDPGTSLFGEETVRCQPALLYIGLIAFVLSSCAHSGSWRTADPSQIRFDGVSPDMVRAITAADTVIMPHPVIRGDSLVARYGHGEAVALDDIEVMQKHRRGSSGLGTGGAVFLAILSVVIVAAVLMVSSLDDCCL